MQKRKRKNHNRGNPTEKKPVVCSSLQQEPFFNRTKIETPDPETLGRAHKGDQLTVLVEKTVWIGKNNL